MMWVRLQASRFSFRKENSRQKTLIIRKLINNCKCFQHDYISSWWPIVMSTYQTMEYLFTACQYLQPNSQIPDWGIESTPAQGCRTCPPAMQPGSPVRQPNAGGDFIPQSGIYEFGYWTFSVCRLFTLKKKCLTLYVIKGTATPSPCTPLPLRLRDCDAASLRSCVRARLYNGDSYKLCVSILSMSKVSVNTTYTVKWYVALTCCYSN